MDLTPYVERIRRELAVAAEAGGEEARELAERLTAPLESAVRLTLLEALAAAAAEITSDLAPGSVHLRLSGRDPEFVVTVLSPDGPAAEEPGTAATRIDESALPAGERGATSRINLRLPDDVKAGVEEAWARRFRAIVFCLPDRMRTAARLSWLGERLGFTAYCEEGGYTWYVRHK